jgi:hypothetical protein
MAKVDDKVQGVYDSNNGTHDKAKDVEDVRGAVQDIGAKVIDGAQVIPKQSPHPDCFLCLDVEKISRCRPIASDFGDLTRS